MTGFLVTLTSVSRAIEHADNPLITRVIKAAHFLTGEICTEIPLPNFSVDVIGHWYCDGEKTCWLSFVFPDSCSNSYLSNPTVKYTTTKQTWPKYDVSHKFPAVTCPAGKPTTDPLGAAGSRSAAFRAPSFSKKTCSLSDCFLRWQWWYHTDVSSNWCSNKWQCVQQQHQLDVTAMVSVQPPVFSRDPGQQFPQLKRNLTKLFFLGGAGFWHVGRWTDKTLFLGGLLIFILQFSPGLFSDTRCKDFAEIKADQSGCALNTIQLKSDEIFLRQITDDLVPDLFLCYYSFFDGMIQTNATPLFCNIVGCAHRASTPKGVASCSVHLVFGGAKAQVKLLSCVPKGFGGPQGLAKTWRNAFCERETSNLQVSLVDGWLSRIMLIYSCQSDCPSSSQT